MSDSGSAGDALRNSIYKRYTGRRMGPLRRMLYRLAAPTILGIARLWWRSCRIVAVVGQEHLDETLARWPSFLPCYWHQHTLFCAQYLLREQRHRASLRIGFLISPSVDGELGAMILRRAQAHVIRGSSSRTGALALKEYYHALTRDSVSPVVSPDGPRGPRWEFKPGAVLLAQMSGRPIVPMAYAASRASFIHWDRFVLPWPFARIAIAIGAPRSVPRVLNAARVEALQQEMAEALKSYFSGSTSGARSLILTSYLRGSIVLLLLWAYRLTRFALATLGLARLSGFPVAAVLTMLLFAVLDLQWPIRVLAALALWRQWHWPWWAALLASAPRLLLVLPGLITAGMARLRHPRPQWNVPNSSTGPAQPTGS